MSARPTLPPLGADPFATILCRERHRATTPCPDCVQVTTILWPLLRTLAEAADAAGARPSRSHEARSCGWTAVLRELKTMARRPARGRGAHHRPASELPTMRELRPVADGIRTVQAMRMAGGIPWLVSRTSSLPGSPSSSAASGTRTPQPACGDCAQLARALAPDVVAWLEEPAGRRRDPAVTRFVEVDGV